MPLAKEGFKLAKALAPALGAGADAMAHESKAQEEFLETRANTFGSILLMLSESIGDDHFYDLQEKLLGSLHFGDSEVKDLDEHFNKYPEDFIEVLVWLFKENFTSFFIGSSMFHSLKEKVTSLLSPKLKNELENFKKKLNEDLN